MIKDKNEIALDDMEKLKIAVSTMQSALSYDTRISGLVPGYEILQEIVPALLSSKLGDCASVLIVGAGTGRELINLAMLYPGWYFTAIDPSAGMLAVAKDKAVDFGVENRITFQVASLDQYIPTHCHDAAICLLVTHFIAVDKKQRFFQDTSRCLKQNAPFIFADLTIWNERPKWAAYKNWALANGMSPNEVEAMLGRISQNYHPISDTHLTQLLNDSKFLDPICFFQALDYRGFYAIKYEH